MWQGFNILASEHHSVHSAARCAPLASSRVVPIPEYDVSPSGERQGGDKQSGRIRDLLETPGQPIYVKV